MSALPPVGLRVSVSSDAPASERSAAACYLLGTLRADLGKLSRSERVSLIGVLIDFAIAGAAVEAGAAAEQASGPEKGGP